ncbi:MAG: redoxin domain-containing protein [Chloroflexi bacterium]|nr:redoxin domain-containing protein [Chloroflexota bacterium]
MISSLNEEYDTILELGAEALCISVDSVESHQSFCEVIGGCKFPLASDPDRLVAREYEAVDESGNAGIRTVYVLDSDGTILHKIPWYQPGNVGQFMEIFQALGLE